MSVPATGWYGVFQNVAPPKKSHTQTHPRARAQTPTSQLKLMWQMFWMFQVRVCAPRAIRAQNKGMRAEQPSSSSSSWSPSSHVAEQNRDNANGDRSNRATGRLNSGVIETQLCLSLIILFGLDVSASAVYISGVRGFFFFSFFVIQSDFSFTSQSDWLLTLVWLHYSNRRTHVELERVIKRKPSTSV